MDVAVIAELGIPVLCIDTCAVLDLMRDPTCKTARPEVRQAGFDLIAVAEHGELAILMAEQVAIEFATLDAKVQEEARQSLSRVREQLVRIDALAAVYGAEGTVRFDHLDDHVERARTLVGRWLATALRVTPSAEIPGKAFARVNAVRAPSKQGKEASKDCLVFETYLEAIGDLRAAGCVADVVFVSSNTNDYLAPGSVMKPDIAADLTPLNATFAVSMEHAKNTLGF